MNREVFASHPTTLLAVGEMPGVTVDEAAVTDHGRVELLHWVREQAVSTLAHRHGHIRASVASPTAS